jgi:hypothetical protein
MGGNKALCWHNIMEGIRLGYMLGLEGMEGPVFAVTGDFDRSLVEDCAEDAFPKNAPIHLTVARNGDTTKIPADMNGEAVGEVALWWRGSQLVLAGTPEQIEELRAMKTGSNACIKGLFTLIPEEPIAAVRCDAFFKNLLGQPTVGWLLGFKMGELGGMAGKVTALYASPEEATAAAKVFAAKDFPVKLPEEIEDFMGRVPVSVEDTRLEFTIDVTTSDMDKLSMSMEDMERLAHELKNQD